MVDNPTALERKFAFVEISESGKVLSVAIYDTKNEARKAMKYEAEQWDESTFHAVMEIHDFTKTLNN